MSVTTLMVLGTIFNWRLHYLCFVLGNGVTENCQELVRQATVRGTPSYVYSDYWDAQQEDSFSQEANLQRSICPGWTVQSLLLPCATTGYG